MRIEEVEEVLKRADFTVTHRGKTYFGSPSLAVDSDTFVVVCKNGMVCVHGKKYADVEEVISKAEEKQKSLAYWEGHWASQGVPTFASVSLESVKRLLKWAKYRIYKEKYIAEWKVAELFVEDGAHVLVYDNGSWQVEGYPYCFCPLGVDCLIALAFPAGTRSEPGNYATPTPPRSWAAD